MDGDREGTVAKQEQAERRTEAITTKITPAERKGLERVAEREQITLSDTVRKMILKDLGRSVPDRSAP